VSDRGARSIAEAHAGFLKSLGAEVGSGETEDLTVRQARLLAQPTKIIGKRKAVKSPAVPEVKKIAKTKKSTGPRTVRKRKLLLDVTDEEKEQAEIDDALAKIEAQRKKEVLLKDGYECGIDASAFDDMHSKLPQRNDPHNLLAQQTLYGSVDAQATISTAPGIHFVDVTEDSDRTPFPPPQKSLTNKDISILEPTPDSEDIQPENNQDKPPMLEQKRF
jgi:hypothetical protein